MSRRADGEKYQVTRGDRMKAYELPWRQLIPHKSYTIIRVDGRAFHTYTRHMERPFDQDLMSNMNQAAVALCQQAQGAQFAYVQSDEISVLLTDFGSMQEPWFGGSVQKMSSISASIVTAAFNNIDNLKFQGLAFFDARVLTVPSHDEAVNYFLWRQRDCYVNFVSMVAECHFSSKELLHKSTAERHVMLADKGVSLGGYGDGAELGRLVRKVSGEHEVSYVHRLTGEQKTVSVVRNQWLADAAPWFDWDQGGWLMQHVPELPKDENGDQ